MRVFSSNKLIAASIAAKIPNKFEKFIDCNFHISGVDGKLFKIAVMGKINARR
jgi:hypothetical protein